MALSKSPLSLYLIADTGPFFQLDLLFNRQYLRSHQKRKEHAKGEFHKVHETIRKSDKEFVAYTGMTVATFDYILANIKDELESEDKNFIPKHYVVPEEKLLITLRYFVTGDSYIHMSTVFCIKKSEILNIVNTTCKVIWKKLRFQHMPDPNVNSLRSVIKEYWRKWQFPNCIGAIGERNVRGSRHWKLMKCIPSALYAMHAIADTNYKFIAVDIVGKNNKNEETFSKSFLRRRLEDNSFGTPPQKMPRSDTILPTVLLADRSYCPETFLLRPYFQNTMNADLRKFNKMLQLARKPVNCAYQMLFSRWKFLSVHKTSEVQHMKHILKTSCLLHNIIRDIEGDSDIYFKKCTKEITRTRFQTNHLIDRSDAPSAEALMTRERFFKYLTYDAPLLFNGFNIKKQPAP